MKIIILTSAGLSNQKITEEFLKLVNKSQSGIKVIFVPTASRTKEELFYVDKSKKELLDIGVKDENIKVFNLDHKISYEEVEGFDVIYVCGGNTPYLLQKVRETGFDNIIKQFVENGKLYFGVSVGSIIAGPSIEISIPFDSNDVKMTDFTGLNLTDIVISPHYKEAEKEIIEEFRKKLKYKIIPLTDNQALLILNNEISLIGD
ncbi:MAG: Type 1 glutamine amidotransferase-like domain-containing protein [Nanoarchaeota archaeon]|nr:Type 1 glutamine amidotransferase-like domain-containing protein [Nanoarchaeota archaeon]MBU4002979.1 Type 1 glutamine amidotransferase-like domain-containing protein [Pseudomonadota bacterium]